LSSSGAYYAISDKPQSASGECSCDYSTSQLDCKVAPEFPVSAPQGPAVCQPAGQTTCAIPNIVSCADPSTIHVIRAKETNPTGAELSFILVQSLCQEGKLIGGLNSDGGFYVTGQSDKASGYCQCDLRGAEWLLRCPDYPTSSSFKPFSQKYIHCSKKPDCKGF
jgi:hypothetical protein